jgi:hypothetical protein
MRSFDELAARHELDEAGNAESGAFATEHRLARILDSIGWRAASEESSEEVAKYLALIVAACVNGHRDLRRLRDDVAVCLWQHADHLDGSVVPREDWEPAATQIIDLYVADQDSELS